jgi:hypothetical protein
MDMKTILEALLITSSNSTFPSLLGRDTRRTLQGQELKPGVTKKHRSKNRLNA